MCPSRPSGRAARRIFPVPIPEAGSVRRPEIDADPELIRDLAYSIIRVLDSRGQAIGPWAGSLSDEDCSRACVT